LRREGRRIACGRRQIEENWRVSKGGGVVWKCRTEKVDED
jgi:hypothetical protein